MPIALFLFGILFLVAAVRGTHDDLFKLLKDDFTGPGNFIYWGLSIWAIGAVGYYRPLKPISVAFMTLILLVMLLRNQGFFASFIQQIGASEATGQGFDTKGLIVDFRKSTGIGPVF